MAIFLGIDEKEDDTAANLLKFVEGEVYGPHQIFAIFTQKFATTLAYRTQNLRVFPPEQLRPDPLEQFTDGGIVAVSFDDGCKIDAAHKELSFWEQRWRVFLPFQVLSIQVKLLHSQQLTGTIEMIANGFVAGSINGGNEGLSVARFDGQ